MKTRDVFKLVVRVLGVIIFLYGLEALLEGTLGALGLNDPKYSMPKYWGARGVVETVFGLLVMRGTIPLADLAFPEDPSQEPPTEAPSESEKSSD